MADINIHSRTDREKTNFSNFIQFQTTGTIHILPQLTRPIWNTTPEFVITSTNLTHRCTIEVLDLLWSDHAPLYLHFTVNADHFQTQILLHVKLFRYDKANWTGYRDYIQANINPEASPASEDEHTRQHKHHHPTSHWSIHSKK